MKEKKFTISTITEIGVFAAIAFALDLLAAGIWRFAFVNGGSISIAILPVLFVTYRRGTIPGMVCGLIVSILQMLSGVYVISGAWYLVLLQILLDYVLTYPLVALAGLIFAVAKKQEKKGSRITFIALGILFGGLFKFLCHFLAGVIFWSSSIAWSSFEGMPVLYSLVYNGAYVLPSIIVSAIIFIIIYRIQPSLFRVKGEYDNEYED